METEIKSGRFLGQKNGFFSCSFCPQLLSKRNLKLKKKVTNKNNKTKKEINKEVKKMAMLKRATFFWSTFFFNSKNSKTYLLKKLDLNILKLIKVHIQDNKCQTLI